MVWPLIFPSNPQVIRLILMLGYFPMHFPTKQESFLTYEIWISNADLAYIVPSEQKKFFCMLPPSLNLVQEFLFFRGESCSSHWYFYPRFPSACVEGNFGYEIVERKIPKNNSEGLISLRIIQENIILWLRSLDSHKCGLDICSNRN